MHEACVAKLPCAPKVSRRRPQGQGRGALSGIGHPIESDRCERCDVVIALALTLVTAALAIAQQPARENGAAQQAPSFSANCDNTAGKEKVNRLWLGETNLLPEVQVSRISAPCRDYGAATVGPVSGDGEDVRTSIHEAVAAASALPGRSAPAPTTSSQTCRSTTTRPNRSRSNARRPTPPRQMRGPASETTITGIRASPRPS